MTDDEILQLLRESPSSFLSGEEISHRLKVSRTAVWKRINHLRNSGYEIEASTRSGYRLIRS
ncbi:MAG: HTH domain-containing protein, partial [Syntrophaceae bacterium]|nr:HTH domain-containing protein [Syntrophaceae bacterium]